MQIKQSIISLNEEIPVVETTKEGFIRGGFTSISTGAAINVKNLNCPNAANSTCYDSPVSGIDYENVNCPKASEATCGSTAAKKKGIGILPPTLWT